jgi:uncharacterized protein with von Willebrand factor type A (vWA) domain
MTEGKNTSNPGSNRIVPGLAGKVIDFSSFLKGRGLKIFSSDIMDSLKGLQDIDIADREDFLSVLRANLVTTYAEWKLFRELFDEFWQEIEYRHEDISNQCSQGDSGGEGELLPGSDPQVAPDHEEAERDPCEEETLTGVTYSPVECLQRKNLALFDKGDIPVAQLILKNMISTFRLTMTRRFKRSKKASGVDFRRVLRNSLKTDGLPIHLFYKRRRKRLKRLVILTDVSGSMERYARFVMPFIMGLKGVGSKADVFVFSTSLT